MSVRYRNRQRRLERTVSRMETARRTVAAHAEAAAEQRAWWRRHSRTLAAWRHAIAERQRLQPTARPTIEADRFARWTSRLQWHPRMLRLRLECWWLTLRLGVRNLGRGPRA